MINTNLGSLFNMCRQVIEGMRARKFGRIVNISSINGQKGQFGQVNYSAAKAGEIGFTKALAQEGARAGITVNAICPGYIATDMVKAMSQEVLQKNVLPLIPIGRLGEPEEIARCVVFLAVRRCRADHRLDIDGQRRTIFRVVVFGRPVLRRQLESRELETRRDGAADKRPVAERLRRLPGLSRHDRLRPLAGGKIAAECHALDTPRQPPRFRARAAPRHTSARLRPRRRVPVRALAASRAENRSPSSRRGRRRLPHIAKPLAEMIRPPDAA